MRIASLRSNNPKNIKIAEQAHENWKHADNIRDQGLNPKPKDIIKHTNLKYGPDKKHNLIDVYRPANAKIGKLPLIIDMHGKGFVYGSRKTYQFYCMHLARAGFEVVSYDYRLAPKYPFPCAWDDTQMAVRWCVKNAYRYGFDLQHVFIIGDSAGANLAEEYLTLYTNPIAAAKFDFKRPPINIMGGVFNCGVFFINKILGYVNPVESTYYTHQVTQHYPDFVHIDNYIKRPFLPVFVQTASDDDMINQSFRMDQLLIDHEIPHLYKIYGSDDFPREHDFQIDQSDPIADRCDDDELSFFKRLLKRENVQNLNEKQLSQITI